MHENYQSVRVRGMRGRAGVGARVTVILSQGCWLGSGSGLEEVFVFDSRTGIEQLRQLRSGLGLGLGLGSGLHSQMPA